MQQVIERRLARSRSGAAGSRRRSSSSRTSTRTPTRSASRRPSRSSRPARRPWSPAAPGVQSAIKAMQDEGKKVGVFKMPAFGEGAWAESLVQHRQRLPGARQWSEQQGGRGGVPGLPPAARRTWPDAVRGHGQLPRLDELGSVDRDEPDRPAACWSGSAENDDVWWAANYTPVDLDVNGTFVVCQKMMAGEIDVDGAVAALPGRRSRSGARPTRRRSRTTRRGSRLSEPATTRSRPRPPPGAAGARPRRAACGGTRTPWLFVAPLIVLVGLRLRVPDRLGRSATRFQQVGSGYVAERVGRAATTTATSTTTTSSGGRCLNNVQLPALRAGPDRPRRARLGAAVRPGARLEGVPHAALPARTSSRSRSSASCSATCSSSTGSSTARSTRSASAGSTQDWLGSSDRAIWTIMVVIVWKELGFGIIVFLARLCQRERGAVRRRAGRRRGVVAVFRHVTLPQLVPAIVFFAVVETITMLSWVFAYVYVMTTGGPGNSTVVTRVLHLPAGLLEQQRSASAPRPR